MVYNENAVLSGALAGWGDVFIGQFTLAVRLVTPTETRIERLRKREYSRFGERIMPGGDMYEQHKAFLEWAAKYDTGDVTMRSKAEHDVWQTKLPCRQIVLDGTLPTETLTESAVKALYEVRSGI